jgi:PKD repeat protein
MTITNGDFETGDLTGWNINTSGGTNPVASTDDKHSGYYSCKIVTADGIVSLINQSIPPVPANIDIWLNIADITGASNCVSLIVDDGDGGQYKLDIPSTSGWEKKTLLIAGLDQSHPSWIISLVVNNDEVPGTATVYFDDVGIDLYPPIASFTSVKTGLSVEFTDTSTNNPTSWDWDFGDGETSTDQNPTHVYAQEWGVRNYVVTLMATNYAGSDVSDPSEITTVDGDLPQISVVILGTRVGESDETLYPDPLSIEVDWDINKKYWLATVVIGGNFALPASDDHPTITITVPDFEMANQTIFYGFVAGASHTQKFSEKTTTLICYSFGWYLSNQNVPIRSTIASWSSGGGAVFFTPDEMINLFLGTSIAGDNWAYTTGINPYNIDTNPGWGDPLTWYALLNGAVDNDDTEFAFDNATGTLSGTSNIWRGTEMLTTSDTATPLTVTRAQGGTTAIAHPDNSILIKLNTSITAPQKGFVWTPTTKKRAAIQELEEYNDFLFYEYWKSLTGEWTPVAYWIAGDDIDTAMDLPAQVTIPIADPNLIDSILTDEKNDEIVNRVIIWGGIDPMTNLRYYSMAESAAVTAHTVKPKEYTECEDKYDSQSAVNDRADLVLEQMSLGGTVHTLPKLNKRTDLRAYQLITVTDSDNVLEVDMRIIGIHYSIKSLADMQVTINFISDRKFTAARKLKKVSVSSQWSEVNESIAEWYSRILLADMVDIQVFGSGSGVAKNTYGDYVPVTGSNS